MNDEKQIDLKIESKADKFKRITGMRSQRILDDLRLLGNCGNTSNYEYTAADTFKLFSAIEKEVARVKLLFNKPVPHPYTITIKEDTDTAPQSVPEKPMGGS